MKRVTFFDVAGDRFQKFVSGDDPRVAVYVCNAHFLQISGHAGLWKQRKSLTTYADLDFAIYKYAVDRFLENTIRQPNHPSRWWAKVKSGIHKVRANYKK
jgi:hypothetical protein